MNIDVLKIYKQANCTKYINELFNILNFNK